MNITISRVCWLIVSTTVLAACALGEMRDGDDLRADVAARDANRDVPARDVTPYDVQGDRVDVPLRADASDSGDAGDAYDPPRDVPGDRVDPRDGVDTSDAADVTRDVGLPIDCAERLTRCGDACVDLQSDRLNCGACGAMCPGISVCIAGRCRTGTMCPPGQFMCASSCVDLQTDAMNCGACGNICSRDTACVSGSCVSAPSGCRSSDTCARGSVCLFAPGTCGGPGTCISPETLCATDPATTIVCGCDRRTYPSDCDAARAGVSVARRGACDGSTM
jgi:hypothetical protein